MQRFRVRFDFEEFDLRPGPTFFGRSPTCTITLLEPEVSRLHASITVDDSCAMLRDLGSRNGTRVNGEALYADVVLRDGDRIEIGTHTFSVRVVVEALCDDAGLAKTRPLRALGREAELSGESRLLTPSHEFDRRSWWLELQLNLLEKALTSGLLDEADRAFARIAGTFDARADQDPLFEAFTFGTFCERIASLTRLRASGAWLGWLFETMRRIGYFPTGRLVAAVTALPLESVRDAATPLDALLRYWSDRSEMLGGQEATLLTALLAVATDLRVAARRSSTTVPDRRSKPTPALTGRHTPSAVT